MKKANFSHLSISFPIFSFHFMILFSSFQDFFSTYACLPHYNKYKHAYFKLKFSGNVSSVFVSYVFAGVHFLYFGELNMRFFPIAPFRYSKYILNIFECFEVSIRAAIWNIHKPPIFPVWLVQTYLLETSALIFKCTIYHCSRWSLIFSIHIVPFSIFTLRFIFQLYVFTP